MALLSCNMSADSQVGVLPIPSGKVANFDLHQLSESQVGYIIGWSVTFAVATFVLIIRLYTRLRIVNLPGLDDVATCLAWMTTIISFILNNTAIKHGFGKHLWEVGSEDFHEILELITPTAAMYSAASAFTKLSILILLHRLNPNRWFRLSVYLLAIILVAYTLIFNIILGTACSPLKLDQTNCEDKMGLWNAILNILTDAATILLPLPMIYGLNIPFREKVALTGVLSAGMGVVVIAIVRIKYVMSMENNPDITYSECVTGIWSAIEINVGIVCNCVVVIKPFLRKHFPKFFSSYMHSSGLPGAPRSRSYAMFSNQNGNSFHLTSVSNAADPESLKSEVGKDGGIVVTSSYAVEAGPHKTRDAETESTEDIMGSVKREYR